MIIGVTGHRPPRLAGYDRNNPTRTLCRVRMGALLVELGATKGITGMAAGADQDFADVCVELGIPFVAALPFVGQELTWPAEAQAKYRDLLERAVEVMPVCAPGYRIDKFIYRDHWIVDNCEAMIAVFDGKKHGGTAKTVRYAEEAGRPVHLIDPTITRRF